MSRGDVAERAVREYLLYLEDPTQLVNEEEVSKLRSRVESARGPIERLLAISAFERARHPLEADYRQAFVEHAKGWALEHEVPASAFRALGVPPAALTDAGIESGSRTPPAGGKRQVTVGDIQSAVATMAEMFTAADVVAAAHGGSPMTIRKALARLVDDGAIERIGPARDWSSPGRAPIVYRRLDK